MLNVFLADDEPWILISMKKIVNWTEEGFVICGEATDGVKALDRIKKLKPDVVISDIKMPGIDGMELIKSIRKEKMDTDIIILSGYSEFEYAKTAIHYGCSDYLIKPVDEDELLQVLRNIRAKHLNIEKNEESSVYNSESKIFQAILSYMKENYSDITQQAISEKYHMSVSAISNLFKKQTGRSYSDHLLEIRIESAEKLLRTTNYSIEEIAGKVGYNDYFYFMKTFKKATGISASAYRKNL